MNPTVLALSSYLLGQSCILSNCVAILKGPESGDVALHTDSLMIPEPLPPYAQVCNSNWMLTDYSRDNGSICFVPASHRYCRHPADGEAVSDRVPVDAPAGSIVVYHGNTWHGAFNRTNSGLRMSFNTPMMRSYLQPEEAYREDVTPEILARNPPRFATLMQKHLGIPWRPRRKQDHGNGPIQVRAYGIDGGLNMVPDIALRIQTMLRSMSDTVIPSIPEQESVSREQAYLVMAHLRVIADQIDRGFQFQLAELKDFVTLNLVLSAKATGGVASEACARAAKLCADRARPLTELEVPSQSEIDALILELRQTADDLVKASIADGTQAFRDYVSAAVTDHAKRQLTRERILSRKTGF